MKTNNALMSHPTANTSQPLIHSAAHAPRDPAKDPPHQADKAADFDDLVRRAASGDGRAIGAIAIALGPTLLAIARSASVRREDAEDVLQDFYLGLQEGKAKRFPPKPGRALAWMNGLLRSLARTRRFALRDEVSLADIVEDPFAGTPPHETHRR